MISSISFLTSSVFCCSCSSSSVGLIFDGMGSSASSLGGCRSGSVGLDSPCRCLPDYKIFRITLDGETKLLRLMYKSSPNLNLSRKLLTSIEEMVQKMV